MPKRTNAFQRLVALIHATLAGHANVTESAMLRDKVTGEEREVDILLTTREANYDMLICIEVVSWNRRADVRWVEQMSRKHENIDTNKLILISESGFTKSAIKKARFYKIEALTIEAASETDWPLVAKLGSQGILKLTNLKYECSIVCEFSDGKRELIKAPLSWCLSSGQASITIDEFIRNTISIPDFRDAVYKHINGSGEHNFWFSFESPGLNTFQVEHNGQSGRIQEIRVNLKVLTNETIVQNKTGKLKQSPFLEGTSCSDDDLLQFVLLRTSEGAIRGYLVDKYGTRTMSEFEDYGSSQKI